MLNDLPFPPGEEVEVIVLSERPGEQQGGAYPLRGAPVVYENPTDPVADSEWRAIE